MRIIIATAATYTLMHISKHGQNIIKGAKLFPVPNDCNFLEEIKALTNSKEFHLQMFWWKSNWCKVKVW